MIKFRAEKALSMSVMLATKNVSILECTIFVSIAKKVQAISNPLRKASWNKNLINDLTGLPVLVEKRDENHQVASNTT